MVLRPLALSIGHEALRLHIKSQNRRISPIALIAKRCARSFNSATNPPESQISNIETAVRDAVEFADNNDRSAAEEKYA
jgi:hypothetical protein